MLILVIWMVAIFLDMSKIRNQMILKSGFTITNSHLIVYPFVVSINCPRIRKTQQTKEKVPVIKNRDHGSTFYHPVCFLLGLPCSFLKKRRTI
jgi:hypothetical protein